MDKHFSGLLELFFVEKKKIKWPDTLTSPKKLMDDQLITNPLLDPGTKPILRPLYIHVTKVLTFVRRVKLLGRVIFSDSICESFVYGASRHKK